MRVVVIDPYERTITEGRTSTPPNFREFQQIVGGTFQTLHFTDTDCYINENGRYLEEQASFVYVDPKHGPTVPLIGRAFLCWHRGDVETDCKLSLDTVRERVRWEHPGNRVVFRDGVLIEGREVLERIATGDKAEDVQVINLPSETERDKLAREVFRDLNVLTKSKR
jgi:hypothetical protein